MGNKKVLYIIIIVLLLIIVAGAYLLIKSNAKQETPSDNKGAPNNEVQTLSEQPNQAKLNEYISSGKIILAKLLLGKEIEPPQNMPVETKVFDFSEDQFCVMMTLKKTVPANSFSSAVYDTVTKENIEPKTSFPVELKQGGMAGCQPGTYPAGKYEYKVYADDILIAVLPFEVK